MARAGSLPLGVLVSGTGSNLQAMLDAIDAGTLDARVCLVISNRSDALALERARRAGVLAAVVPHGDFATREAFEDRLLELLHAQGVQWVALAGFMRVLSPHFIRGMHGRVLNIHPSLLPAFPGLHAHRQALAHGVRLSGATVHLVDEGVDTGPILVQAAVPVLPDDTEATLSQRILKVEHRIYARALQWIAEGRIAVYEGRILLSGAVDAPSEALIFP